MRHPAPTKTKSLRTMPCRKIEVKDSIRNILHLPGGQRIITNSWEDGSFRVWDLERATQVGEEWEDKDAEVRVMALSPGGKTVASGSWGGTVKMWNVNTGKVVKTWTGHTEKVNSVCWSPDGGRVVSGSYDGTFRVWDVQSGETILGPIKAGSEYLWAVSYSPDGTKIATAGGGLKIWHANTGELLKTINGSPGCLAWTSNGKTLVAGGRKITKFNTATWTEIAVVDGNDVKTISLSPNERILASTFFYTSNDVSKTVQLWNLETNQPIGTPLHHEERVNSATFSADGKFLITSCDDGHICTWDLSAIVEAGLLSNNADTTPRPAPKMNGARRVPPGFFDNALREANLHVRLSQSHGPHTHPTPPPRQRTLSHFPSFWRRSKSHRATGRDPQPRSQPLSWTRSLVSGMMRRRDGSDIELREPSVVEVPCAPGKPRNYHASRKAAASSSRPSKIHTVQQPSATTQGAPSSSQLPPPAATASTLPIVSGAGTAGTSSRPHITVAGWRTRFVAWLCCLPIQNTAGQQ